MKHNKVIGLSMLCFAGLLIWKCSPTSPDHAGNISQTGNGMVMGILYQPDGHTPAANAKVYLRKRNTLADTTGTLTKRLALPDTATTTTNDSGKFVIDSVDTGTYVIEGSDGSNNLAINDSVPVTDPDSTIILPPDTLKPAGAIKGAIRLSEGGDPGKVFVLAFGIDRFAGVNTDGSFKFNALAEGKYDLRLISSLANYGVLDTSNIAVVSADTTDLDTIDLPFTGIPTPMALSATYDTLANKVSLSWSTENPNLVSGYKVYRREGTIGQYALANDSLLLTTSFNDNLVNGLEKGKTYQYMVRAVDTNENEGLNSDPVMVRIAFFVDAGKDTTYQLGDSVTLNARIDSTTVTPVEFRFDADGDGTNDLVSPTATTFKYAYADTGTYKAVITIQASGKSFSDTVKIIIVPKDTAGAPVAPQGLSLSYDTLKQIVTLTWIRNLESDIKGYNVYRKHSDSAFVKINTALISGTTFSDSTAEQDQTYEYRISAIDKNTTEGTKSAGVSVKVVGAFAWIDTVGVGQLTYPGELKIDSKGRIIVPNIDPTSSNHNVIIFDSAYNFVKSFGEGILNYPASVVIDSMDNIYVGAQNGVFRFDLNGNILDTFFLTTSGFPIDFLAISDTFLYVSHGGTGYVKKYSLNGDSIATWGGVGDLNGQFVGGSNYGLVVFNSKVYVCDQQSRRIQLFDLDGKFLNLWQEPFSSYVYAQPIRISLDSNGNFYIVLQSPNSILIYSENRVQLGKIEFESPVPDIKGTCVIGSRIYIAMGGAIRVYDMPKF